MSRKYGVDGWHAGSCLGWLLTFDEQHDHSPGSLQDLRPGQLHLQ
jgi:hypothetical protein